MSELLFQHFGEACWHRPEKPCPELVHCLQHGPRCGADETKRAEHEELIAQLKREKINQPVIYVGTGTCGLGAGAGKTLAAVNQYLADHQLNYPVVEVGCVGMCSNEPLLEVQLPGRPRVMFAKVTAEKVNAVLDGALSGKYEGEGIVGQDKHDKLAPYPGVPYLADHEFFKPQTRWVLVNCGIIDPNSIEEYIARGGYQALTKALKTMTPAAVCDTVEKSGLRGRGGAGFPTGTKWKFALNQSSAQKYVICNADEGDPGAFMDRAVIEGDPHRVLEGLTIAAYAIGANKAYIYIRAEYPLAIKRLKTAIAQSKEYGLIGQNILDSGFNFQVVIKQGAGAFVCGEETALIHSVEGKRGMPRPRPPFPAVSGLFGKPTVINNVETLANLAAILDHGPEWFSAVGTAGSKGTKVFALSGKVRRTGLVEVAMGTSVRQIVFDIGGGPAEGKTYKAVQMGGPSGGCIPEQHLDIDVDYESLKRVGAIMGSGGMVVMDSDNCMVDVAKFFMDFIQRESCGKCIPCREGTRRMLEILQSITRGRRAETGFQALERFKGTMHLEHLAEVIKDTSLCGLGQTAPNPVLSTLRWFRHEYEAHIFDRHCPAGVCTELLNYTINPEVCTGCTSCARKCPAEAIMGNPKAPHYIVQDKCIGCGTCLTVCRFHAVSAS
ncbi:MAG: NADH-quinone oxidoreductase subunit NuoF [Myxococcales bacterium]|nr:NADH-quinone oxidoreductase subunit NuoF [Myxococcales bacterium]